MSDAEVPLPNAKAPQTMPENIKHRLHAFLDRTGRFAVAVLVAYLNMPISCQRCRTALPRYEMRHLSGVSRISYSYAFCPNCADAIQQGEKHCIFCGSVPEKAGLCGTCYTEQRAHERTIMQTQLERARREGTPATLTPYEWFARLDAYEWKCAYCQTASYEALEHIVPMAKGGGTTFDNCVPACTSCNLKKGDRHPEEYKRMADAIRRIEQETKEQSERLPK